MYFFALIIKTAITHELLIAHCTLHIPPHYILADYILRQLVSHSTAVMTFDFTFFAHIRSQICNISTLDECNKPVLLSRSPCMLFSVFFFIYYVF